MTVTITFEQVRAKIEDMTSLTDEQTKEALEKVSEFSILHGQGVAAGMCMVLEMGEKSGLIPSEVVQRQKNLIRNTGLPEYYDLDRGKVYQALFSDKKTVGGKLRFVITPEMGRAEIVTFQPETVREYLGI